MIAFLIAVVAQYFMTYNKGEADSGYLKRCEQMLQSELRAPSTYKRISAIEESTGIWLTYEAQNSLGVTLRSTASCSPDGDLQMASLSGY